MEKAKPLVGRTTTLALDFSDLSKPFGGEGMEGMAKGWDGSRHCTAYEHDFISVSVVSPDFADAVPVYVKIARGRKSKGDLQTYRGTVKARVKWKPGVFTDDCGSPTSLSSRFPTRPERIDIACCH